MHEDSINVAEGLQVKKMDTLTMNSVDSDERDKKKLKISEMPIPDKNEKQLDFNFDGPGEDFKRDLVTKYARNAPAMF